MCQQHQGWVQGTSKGQKSSWSTGTGAGAFGGEAIWLASATFAGEVLASDLFFPLLFFSAAITSRAASSNLLVPPTTAVNDGMGPVGGREGAPLPWQAGGVGTLGGRGRDDWAWGGAINCVGGKWVTLCDRSRRLNWIWLSWFEWSVTTSRELATWASRSFLSRRSSSTGFNTEAMAGVIEQKRGRMVLSARVRSPTSPQGGDGELFGGEACGLTGF